LRHGQSVQLLVQSSPLAGFRYAEAAAVCRAQARRFARPGARSGNPHDPNAVRVEWRGRKLGYVPRRQNAAIAWGLDRGTAAARAREPARRASEPGQAHRVRGIHRVKSADGKCRLALLSKRRSRRISPTARGSNSTPPSVLAVPIARGIELMAGSLRSGGKILACGNGGSAADAQHLRRRTREPLRARAAAAGRPGAYHRQFHADLDRHDYATTMCSRKQVRALGRKGDVLLAISTSGNSASVVAAMRAARDLGVAILALTGAGGGKMAEHLGAADVHVCVPHERTMRIQEVHLLVLHCLCDGIDTAAIWRQEMKDSPANSASCSWSCLVRLLLQGCAEMTTAGTAVGPAHGRDMVETRTSSCAPTNRVSERFGDKVHVKSPPSTAACW
jgi:D-sedoheptulose 7-phosphate isomerase